MVGPRAGAQGFPEVLKASVVKTKILIHEVSAARIVWKRYQKLPVSLVVQARDLLLRPILVGVMLVFRPGPSSASRLRPPPLASGS